ncbi:MAG: DeoR/GlpR family DNA-binding transcription regulator, partial [Chloroflexota bacterium]
MTSDDSAPLAIERQRIILDILRREGVVRNAELREMLNVSLVTIRSDLRELEKLGECEVIWGGAVSTQPPREEESLLAERSQLHQAEKQRIGARAVEFIEPGQTIFLDAGSTTVEVARQLPAHIEYLRVMTPALNVAAAVAYHPNAELVMPGGILRNLTRSLVGPQTLRGIEQFNADIVFLASGGYSVSHGITTSNILELDVKRTMVKYAKMRVLVADSS